MVALNCFVAQRAQCWHCSRRNRKCKERQRIQIAGGCLMASRVIDLVLSTYGQRPTIRVAIYCPKHCYFLGCVDGATRQIQPQPIPRPLLPLSLWASSSAECREKWKLPTWSEEPFGEEIPTNWNAWPSMHNLTPLKSNRTKTWLVRTSIKSTRGDRTFKLKASEH